MSKILGVLTNNGKFVRKSVLDNYVVPESKQISDTDTFNGQYMDNGLKVPQWVPEMLAMLPEINTYHKRAMITISKDVSSGYEITPRVDNPDVNQKAILEGLFDQCEEGFMEQVYKLMYDYSAIGYGAFEIIRDGNKDTGLLASVLAAPSKTIRVHRDKNKYCQIRGMKRVWFKKIGYPYDVDYESGKEFPLGELDSERRANEMKLFVDYSSSSETYGAPAIIPAIPSIEGDVARQSYNIAFFQNYGVPSCLVTVTGNYDPDSKVPGTTYTLEEYIQSYFDQIKDNPHSTMMIGIPSGADGKVEIKVEKLDSQDSKDASFTMYRKDNRDEILSANGVPPYIMGINETGSLGGNTSEQSITIYNSKTVKPRQAMIARFVNGFICKELGITDYEFSFTLEDDKDDKADLDIAKDLFDRGALSPNDLIRFFGTKFGVKPSNDKALSYHYVNNVAIDGPPVVAPVVQSDNTAVNDTINKIMN